METIYMPNYLTGPQIKTFIDALNKAFNLPKFDLMLLGRLDKDRNNYNVVGPDFETIILDVVKGANMEGWVMDLLTAARASRPNSADLMLFEESLQLGVIPQQLKNNLERIVNERHFFVNPMKFRETLGQIESWICAIEIPGGGGTGTLIATDLVLTNYHVVAPILNGQVSPANVRCRFDYKASLDGSIVNAGQAVKLADNWDLKYTPYSQADLVPNGSGWGRDELDFALIRLAEKIGDQPIGLLAEMGAPARGWLSLLSNPPDVKQDDVLFIMQHPQDINQSFPLKLQPMQLAIGKVLGFVGNGLRLRHDTLTLPGSSGSPCFDANLNLVALHHAGEPNSRLDFKGSYNQAIPFVEIVRYLQENDVDVFNIH